MHTFFYGWRRKVGIVTLVMACAVAGLWVRSGVVCDVFSVKSSPTSQHVVWLADSGLWWASIKRFSYERLGDKGRILNWESPPANWRSTFEAQRFGVGPPHAGSPYDRSFNELKPTIHWRRRFLGGDFGNITRRETGPFGRQRPENVWFMPLWWFTLPLTLLSACLILWKPRKREVIRPPQS